MHLPEKLASPPIHLQLSNPLTKRHGTQGGFSNLQVRLTCMCNVPCCVHVRILVSIAGDLCVQSTQTWTENKTRTRESNRANLWLQTVHEQEDQQQITFTHKCPIIKCNVESFTIPFPLTVPVHLFGYPIASATHPHLSHSPPV